MEEEKNDLDNLIIQSDKPSGLKKLLLAAAILLLVLIIIILVTKSLVQPEEKPRSSIILPPEPTQQKAAEPREPLFEEVPIQEEKTAAPAPAPAKHDTTPPEKAAAKPAPARSETRAPAATPVAKPKPAAKAAPVAAAPEPAPVRTPAAAKGRYYIQVGAFFRYPPDKKFLESIEKEGFTYTIVEGVRNGTSFKKVLVGPYPSRSAAKKDLDRIKRRINQNAYVLKK
jgi:DedD protein